MNIYLYVIIITFLMTMMDVFMFRLSWGTNASGWDPWHGTKWILIAFLIADKYISHNGLILPAYKEAGLMLMWLLIITVGLHHVILHKIFKDK